MNPPTIARLEERLKSARWYKRYYGTLADRKSVESFYRYSARVKSLERELAAEMQRMEAAAA